MAGAEARLNAAEASTGEARAARLPTVAATALANQYQEPMVVAPLHGFNITAPPQFESTLYQGHASAQYTLFDGGARSARIRVAEARTASAESGVTAARDGVLAEATSAYLSVLSAADVLRAHDRWLTALEQEQDRATLLFEQGKTARVAVLRAQASLSRARAEREAADEGLRLAVRRLSRVSGIDAARIDSAGLVPVAVRSEALPDRDALVERARQSNPALAQAASRVTAMETGVSAAKSSYLPRVSLSGQYSAFGAPGADLATEWQAGIQLSYPLFTGGARGAGVERAEAEAAAARSDRLQAEQQVADAVDAALVAYRSARARVTALEAAVEQSAEVARIEALALESGAGVQTDYLRAEAQLVQARSGLAEARHSQAQARVRLAQATGTLTMEWLAQMTEGAER
jgi:outer membrane protein TolC